MKRTILVALILAATACSDLSQRNNFTMCVHAQGVTFTPGAPCPLAPTFRESQVGSMVIEADNLQGPVRSANLEVVIAPTGWGVALGGTTIGVPGQQTLTFTVPANATGGFYPIVIRAAAAGKEETTLTWNVKVTTSNPS